MQRYHHDINFILEKLTYSIALIKTLLPGKSLAHFIEACQERYLLLIFISIHLVIQDYNSAVRAIVPPLIFRLKLIIDIS